MAAPSIFVPSSATLPSGATPATPTPRPGSANETPVIEPGCGRAFQYWSRLEAAAGSAGADPEVMAALLTVEGSGERSVSHAGALGVMQLLPDKFAPDDDPFSVSTNLLRAAQYVAALQRRYGTPELVAAAYFGAIDGSGRVTAATDGHVNGLEYVRRFQAARACVQAGLGRPVAAMADVPSSRVVAVASARVSEGAQPTDGAAVGQASARSPVSAAAMSIRDQAVQFQMTGLGDVRNPRVWANVIVWETWQPTGRAVEAYDLELGLKVRVGESTGEQFAPAIYGDVIAWLDTRHAGEARTDAVGDTSIAGLVDVYAFDLATGRERRLTTEPGYYDAPAVGPMSIAWARRDALGSTIQLYDLANGTVSEADRSRGYVSNLAISERVLAWIDRPREPGEDGELRAYDLATGQVLPARRGPTGRPVVVGSGIFWEEADGVMARLIRGLDVTGGEVRTIAPDLRPRRGLAGSGGALLWEEPADDGRAEIRMYGVASHETVVLPERPSDGGAPADVGHGTVIWPSAQGELLVTYLPDWDLPDGHFYATSSRDRRSGDALGYGLTNEGGIPFWDEFLRLGGIAALGRPVSGRIQLADGLAYQATELALLQWRPDLGHAVLVDALEILEQEGHGAWLHDRRQIPRTIPDARGQSPQVRLSWLTDPAIREQFLASPDPERAARWTLDDAIERYGLPLSKPEDFGPFVAQRFERAVLQHWKSAATQPEEPEHVTLVHIGTILAEVLGGATQTDD